MGFADLREEVGFGAEGDGFASARWALQVGGEESDGKLAALAEAAGLEVEADRNGREADADFSLAKFDRGAVRGLAQLRGADGEGVASGGRHATGAVSKEKPPPE